RAHFQRNPPPKARIRQCGQSSRTGLLVRVEAGDGWQGWHGPAPGFHLLLLNGHVEVLRGWIVKSRVRRACRLGIGADWPGRNCAWQFATTRYVNTAGRARAAAGDVHPAARVIRGRPIGWRTDRPW